MPTLQIHLTLSAAARIRSAAVEPNKGNTDISHLLPAFIACLRHWQTVTSSSPILPSIFVAGAGIIFPQGLNDVILDPKTSPHLISAQTPTWISFRLQRRRVDSQWPEAGGVSSQIPNPGQVWRGPIRLHLKYHLRPVQQDTAVLKLR